MKCLDIYEKSLVNNYCLFVVFLFEDFIFTVYAHTVYPGPIAKRGVGHLIKYLRGNES